MFPSKQLMSEWINLLEWYTNCTSAFECMREHLGIDRTISEESKRVIEELLIEGAEIVKAPPTQFSTSAPCDYNVNLSLIDESISVDQNNNTSTRISLPKFYDCDVSTKLLHSVLDLDYEQGLKGNLFHLKLFVWRRIGLKFLSQSKQCHTLKSVQMPSLEFAKQILDSLSVPMSLEYLSKYDIILNFYFSTTYIELYALFKEAEKVYIEVLDVLNEVSGETQEITEEWIVSVCAKLKKVRSSVKALNDQGIGFDTNISNEIDRFIRDLNWTKSIFSYPFIRDGTFNFLRKGYNQNDTSADTIKSNRIDRKSVV